MPQSTKSIRSGHSWLTLLLGVSVAMTACSSGVDGPDDGGDGGTRRDVERLDSGELRDVIRLDGGRTNTDVSTVPTDVPEESCGSTSVPIQGVPPNVLIVFDRSGSMRQTISGNESYWLREGDGWAAGPTNPPSDNPIRWTIAKNAIERVIARYGARIRWGIEFFPAPGSTNYQGDGNDSCQDDDVTTPQVLPGATASGGVDSGQLVLAQLALRRTTTWDNRGPGTPTVRALQVAADAASGLRDTSRGNFVLLMTDGEATCGATTDSQRNATTALRNLPTNVRTAVVGISTAVGRSSLTAIANAGGMPRNGDPPYYLAVNQDELNAAFDAIAAQSLSCTFRLQSAPPAGARIYVSVDGTLLDSSATEGYQYTAATNSITLNGSKCTALRAGTVRQLNVSYGCRAVVTCTPNTNTEWCDGIDNDCDGTVDDQCIRIPG